LPVNFDLLLHESKIVAPQIRRFNVVVGIGVTACVGRDELVDEQKKWGQADTPSVIFVSVESGDRVGSPYAGF
jgi:hypothetical protein